MLDNATDLNGAEGGSSSPEREKFMDDETAHYEDVDDKCFDEQQTENGVEGEEEKYMDEGEVQSARSVYMRFFPRAMELILCL